MTEAQDGATPPAGPGRPRRDRQALLDAAAAVFVRSGVDAPVREIATEGGVGVGTIYRHFPTRAELVVAVFRHQVEACAEAGPRLLEQSASAEEALREWIRLFVEFLVTKHGLAAVLHGDGAGSDALHTSFVDRLVPVCGALLDAARAEVGPVGRGSAGAESAVDGYGLLRGVGNLCIGAAGDARYDARELVAALVTGVLVGVPR
ncbi:TetR/AcrR family transcriptional regulator [Clavibacter zhangzhiyongii]|uniref:TetR/AcrR family transcriptional regulator n=1 Tax=Clavibacter zhangzhiyongii TaxID=2768071 RepID=UPI0039DF7453